MSTSLRMRALQQLQDNPQGMRSFDLLGSLGETDKANRKRLAALLQALKARKFITMTPSHANPQGGAIYAITAAGAAQLAKLLQEHGEPLPVDDDIVLTTGAMRGEQPIVLQTVAQTGQITGMVCASPFSMWHMTGDEPRAPLRGLDQ